MFKELKSKSQIIKTQLEKLGVDTVITIGYIINSEDKSYPQQVCTKIIRDIKPITKGLETPKLVKQNKNCETFNPEFSLLQYENQFSSHVTV